LDRMKGEEQRREEKIEKGKEGRKETIKDVP
jgi:hypothetical protein